MELKKHNGFRNFMIVLYFVSFAAYFVVGLSPAFAKDYTVDSWLEIPSINLSSEVTTLKPEDHRLSTPDYIVGSYSREINKTLLIGHSSTVFTNLDRVSVGNSVLYGENEYHISNIEILKKEDISMEALLSDTWRDTIIIMTCAGDIYDNGDASHRLIVTAFKN